MDQQPFNKKIALISTPWPLFNHPSIQLGSLKAFCQQKLPNVKIDNLHIYLDIAATIGYELYNKLSQSTWLSEPIYGALLYPEMAESIKKLWDRYARSIFKNKRPGFEDLCNKIHEKSQSILHKIDWSNYFLVGFSICFSQLTSSLYFMKEIKKIAPDCRIVIGGSSCSGEMGKSLIETFPEIDFVIQGEGELPLYHLIKSLLDSEKQIIYPGIISRSHDGKGVSQIKDLDELPLPDYSDYFHHADNIGKMEPFQPKLSVEMSRGCWWGRCNFCNLNIQWKGYRSKSIERMLQEVNSLVKIHQILSISFKDNLLPPNMKGLFEQIKLLNKDLRLFAEIRAKTPLHTLVAMGEAGMREVQVGIEALSTSLLKKMNKGTSTMDNIEIMKNCEPNGMPLLVGNLILQFPGSDENDVMETLRNLDFVFPFHPLKGIPFWLGYGSYVWQDPSQFFINGIKNHKSYMKIFPPSLVNRLSLMIQDYNGEKRNQQKMWRPVKEKLKTWQKFYQDLHCMPRSEPILSYQEGGDFLIIRQRMSPNKNITHKLKGLSRNIYLYCQHNRSIPEIIARFNGLDELRLVPFLKMMVDKRLMFSEDSRYLSLAVPLRGWRP